MIASARRSLGTLLALGVALGGAWLCAAPRGAPAAGVITGITGKPEVKRAAKGSFDKAKLNQILYEGDTIRTKSRELVSLAFLGGAEMRINEQSSFTLERAAGGGNPSRVRTSIGQAWTRLLHGKNVNRVEIATRQAVCSVRGTEADVEAQEQLSTVKVYDGAVDVTNDHGSQSLTAGQMTSAGADSAPQAPRSMTTGDKGTWQESIQPKEREIEIEVGGKKIKLKLKQQ